MKKIYIVLVAVVASLFLVGCTNPSLEVANGSYKGEMTSYKLKQSSSANLLVAGDKVVVLFPDLVENKQACEATFDKTKSKVAGTTVYSGDFDGAIGMCRIFVQDPSDKRFVLIQEVGSSVKVVISRDELGTKPLVGGMLTK